MFADAAFYFLRQCVLVLLEVVGIAFFVRAILSWFDPMGEWRISGFLYVLTEPVTVPVRVLFDRMGWFQGIPVDIAYMVTWLLVSLLQLVLSVL